MKAFPKVQFINLYSVSESHDIACVDLSQWYSSVKVRTIYYSFFYVGHIKCMSIATSMKEVS